jgi:hypothetical protein
MIAALARAMVTGRTCASFPFVVAAQIVLGYWPDTLVIEVISNAIALL